MKNKSLSFFLLISLGLLLTTCKKKVDTPAPKQNLNYKDPNSATPATGGTTAPYNLVFWTMGTYGALDIYVNGYYQGRITQPYATAPSCNAVGCVTVGFTTTGTLNYAAYTTSGVYVIGETISINYPCYTYELY